MCFLVRIIRWSRHFTPNVKSILQYKKAKMNKMCLGMISILFFLIDISGIFDWSRVRKNPVHLRKNFKNWTLFDIACKTNYK